MKMTCAFLLTLFFLTAGNTFSVQASEKLLPQTREDAPKETLASKVKPYPLETCIVSDNKLGSMGRVFVQVYNGQEVKFCCKPCVGKFEKNPERYLDKL